MQIAIDTASLDLCAADLKAAAEALVEKTEEKLAEGGALVMTAARARAAAFSRKVAGAIGEPIPGAGSVLLPFPTSIPLPRLFEEGNKPGSEAPTSFRHPVWGNRDNWVSQKAHPFWRVTLRALTPQVIETVEEGVNELLAGLQA